MHKRIRSAVSLWLSAVLLCGLALPGAMAAEEKKGIELTIAATSDVHGQLLPIDYATNNPTPPWACL